MFTSIGSRSSRWTRKSRDSLTRSCWQAVAAGVETAGATVRTMSAEVDPTAGSPRGSSGGRRPPPTRSRAATSTTTGGPSSTIPGPAVRNPAGTPATRSTAGARTSTSSPISGSAPTASRSSGAASSRPKGSGRRPPSTTTAASRRPASSGASSRSSRCTTSRRPAGWPSGAVGSRRTRRTGSPGSPAGSAAALGDVIGWACTINEPNIVGLMGYTFGVFPPGSVTTWPVMAVVNQAMVRAHRLAVDALRAGPGGFPVGLTLSMAETGGRGRWGGSESRGAGAAGGRVPPRPRPATTSSASSATPGCASVPDGPAAAGGRRRPGHADGLRVLAAGHRAHGPPGRRGDRPAGGRDRERHRDRRRRPSAIAFYRRAAGVFAAAWPTASTSGATSSGACSTTSSGPRLRAEIRPGRRRPSDLRALAEAQRDLVRPGRQGQRPRLTPLIAVRRRAGPRATDRSLTTGSRTAATQVFRKVRRYVVRI